MNAETSHPLPAPPRVFPLGRVVLALCLAAVAAGTWLLHRAMVTAMDRETPRVEELPRIAAIPAFAFTSEQGAAVTPGAYRGKVWIADFIFLRCGGICPAMTARMAALQKELSDDPRIRLVSFDVDPDRDTVEDMKAYGKEHGADPARWSFLRGEKADVRKLVREGFKLAIEDASPTDLEPILHSPRFALVDGEGVLRGTYDSEDPDARQRLVADARRLASALGPAR